MKNRRKIMMWGCLLMAFWLAACHKGDGGKTGVGLTAEVSSEMLETGQESMPETATAMETAVELMGSLETISKTMTEDEDIPDLGKVGESDEPDQEAFTWLDWVLAEGLGKEPGELIEDDYLSVEHLYLYSGNVQSVTYEESDVVKFLIKGKNEVLTVPLKNFQYGSIDIEDIAQCSNLKYLRIVLNYTFRPETYLIHYEALGRLQQLNKLEIRLNCNTPFALDIADQVDDISFIYDMPNLTELVLENIDLPDDLSALFSHHFWLIGLYGCNITEFDFSNLDGDVFYPVYLLLGYNQIKDATIITAMQRKMMDDTGNAVYMLDLNNNPLKKIGECMTYEWLEQYGRDLGDVSLDFSGTDFAEYSFDWYATTH